MSVGALIENVQTAMYERMLLRTLLVVRLYDHNFTSLREREWAPGALKMLFGVLLNAVGVLFISKGYALIMLGPRSLLRWVLP
jgi:hypothetical protein